MRWSPHGWDAESLLNESVPSDEEIAAAASEFEENKRSAVLTSMQDKQIRLRRYAELAPAAFQPPSAKVSELVAKVGQNWVSSPAPLGTPEAPNEGSCMPLVSAGHESHPSTTHAATESIFEFLDRRSAAPA